MTKNATASVSQDYVVPELEIRVTPAWIRFIRFVQTEIPFGDITIKIVNAQPSKLVSAKREVRFDKEATLPIEFTPDI